MFPNQSVALSTPNPPPQNADSMLGKLLNYLMGWSVYSNISDPESPHPQNSNPQNPPQGLPQGTGLPSSNPAQGMPPLGFPPVHPAYMLWQLQQHGLVAPGGSGNGNYVSGCGGSVNIGGVMLASKHEDGKPREENQPSANPFPPGPNNEGMF